MQKVYFTSDLHFSHKNILKHCDRRNKYFGCENDITKHDECLISLWNKVITKSDIVYIVGDFAFCPTEQVKKILPKLNGKKFLILGNHDKSSQKLNAYFEKITQIEDKTFKKSNYDFLEEDFHVFMCHYPMVTWSGKEYGSVNVHGHCHGNLDTFNEESVDLRVDVGIDGNLAQYGIVSLEQLYKYCKNKVNGKLFTDYIVEQREKNKIKI